MNSNENKYHLKWEAGKVCEDVLVYTAVCFTRTCASSSLPNLCDFFFFFILTTAECRKKSGIYFVMDLHLPHGKMDLGHSATVQMSVILWYKMGVLSI